MRSLVTGSTGFLGQALVRRLLADGESVKALARDPRRASPLAKLGAEIVVGDVSDAALLKRAAADVEVVYHLAGRLFVPGVPESAYRQVHVSGTRAVLAAAESASGLRRLVHCSTTGVLGVTGDRPAPEEAAIAPTNDYERTKWEAEQMVREAGRQGLPVSIVRPGLVYGPGDLHLLGFFRSIKRGLFRPIGARATWLHPIYVDDQMDAMVLCATHPAALGEAFNTAGRTPVTVAQLASEIAEALGVMPPSGAIPLSVAYVAAGLGDLLPVGLQSLAPLTRSRVDFLTNSRTYDTSKAERLIGFSARTDLRSGLARTVAWYRQEGYLTAPPVPAGLRA